MSQLGRHGKRRGKRKETVGRKVKFKLTLKSRSHSSTSHVNVEGSVTHTEDQQIMNISKTSTTSKVKIQMHLSQNRVHTRNQGLCVRMECLRVNASNKERAGIRHISNRMPIGEIVCRGDAKHKIRGSQPRKR